MIKSIAIKNFLSHRDTTLELDPGVNAIIGPSDSGKTAIFNALNWVINNRPGGEEYISWWLGKKDKTSVNIELDDKSVIQRTKATGINSYRLYHNESERTNSFNGFGQKVPSEISNLLNISDINFQFQLDDPFLFSQSSGQVARYLNQIVDLEMIDIALNNINSRLRSETSNLKSSEEDEDRLNDELSNYAWLSEAEGCLIKLEAQESQIRVGKKNFRSLADLAYNIGEKEREINLIDVDIIGESLNVDLLFDLSDKADSKVIESGLLLRNIRDIETTEKALTDLDEILTFEKAVLDAQKLDYEIEKAVDTFDDLKAHLKTTTEIETQIQEIKLALDDLEKEFHELMPEECPLCGEEKKPIKQKYKRKK